jgi:hypothetical protein
MADFEIDFVSERRYETLLVEVSYKKQRLFQLNKEKGEDAIELLFISDLRQLANDVEMRFSLAEFEAILETAKTALIEEC